MYKPNCFYDKAYCSYFDAEKERFNGQPRL